MKSVKAIFEGSLHAEVNSDGNVEFGNSDASFAPADILKSDVVIYSAEYRAWLNDSWLPKNRLGLEKILKLHSNRKRFADLCGAVAGKNIVPMIGSGMSKASGFSTWREFLHQLRTDSELTPEAVDAFLDAGQYEEAVDALATDMGRPLFDERVEHGLRVENTADVFGPVRLLPELFPNLLLTTNLDDVLEHVYESSGQKLFEVLSGRDIERYRRVQSQGRSTLLKLHGDCRRSEGRVLGTAEYDGAYAPGAACCESLALIYRTRPLLWLGCSLTVDRTVKLVGQVVGEDGGAPRHFAFLPLPKEETTRVLREKELTQRHIFPIWYDGDHDDSIEALLVGLMDHQKLFAGEA